MSELSTSDKINIYNSRKLDSLKIWLLFLFLGWSYGSMGSMGKQILYYLTGGGLLLWAIYRLFTLNGAIKKYNKKVAVEVGIDESDFQKLGV